MRIDIFSIFPTMFDSAFEEGMLRIAQEKKLVQIWIHDLREFTHNHHRQVDDTPYGGGVGMVMKPEPFFEGVESLASQGLDFLRNNARIVLMSPQGVPLDQKIVYKLSKEEWLIFLCGRYEGVDERVRKHLANMEISIGDYILSGGELAAMVVVEAVARSILGVLGKEMSLVEESFSRGLLEYPQYTRPREYRGWKIPEVLLSGNHNEIARWRQKKSLEVTLKKRPDLLRRDQLTDEEKKLLEEQ